MVDYVTEYAEKVLDGHIKAGELVKLACRRHIDDLETAENRGFYFDVEAANHAFDFFSFLKHSKGEWAGRPFELELWQKFIVGTLFGWKRIEDGLRRFRTAYDEIARKNGKSTLAAGVGLYTFIADGEGGAEVYTAATKRDQAKIPWDEAKRMVQSSPALSKRVGVNRMNLHIHQTASKFEPLGADDDTMDGLNVHCAIVDELHAHRDSGVWDVLDTATGSRRQPLMFAITTAGFNQQSFCYQLRDYAVKVLKGVIEDDTFFAFIATIDEGDDWRDPEVWPKANPNYGVSVYEDDMIRLAKKAEEMPSQQNNFLCKRLNVWVNQEKRWISVKKWDEQNRTIDQKELQKRICFGGLDLASKTDIAAFVMLFPPKEEGGEYIVLPRFWMPEENLRDREAEDRVPYTIWTQQGFIEATPGNVIDFRYIRDDIDRLGDQFIIKEIGFDPWNAIQLSQELTDLGFTMVEIRQGYRSMGEASKEFEALVMANRLIHGGHPVLRWMVDNVVTRSDPNGNIMPDKKKSAQKIDGVVALIMALARAIVQTEDEKSIYEKRGVRAF